MEPLAGWWVFVQDVPRGSSPMAWLVAWLPKGHRHLSLAQRVDDGSAEDRELWLVIDPASTGLFAQVALTPPGFVAHNVARGMTAVRLPIRHDGRPYARGWMTCVAVAKYVCGLRWPLVQTPGGIIRRAEREGFEVIRP